MKTKQYLLIIFLFSCFPQALSAQENDFGIWTSVSGTFKIIPKLKGTVEEDFRLRNNAGCIDRFKSTLELNYKISKYLTAGAGYVLINYNHPTLDWETRHRFFGFLEGDCSFGRFNVALREMLQDTYRSGIEKTDTRANPKLYLRTRMKVSYDINNSKISPYLSAEYFNTLNDPQKNDLVKERYTLGARYKINKKNCLHVYYRFINEKDEDDIEGTNILGIGYSFSF